MGLIILPGNPFLQDVRHSRPLQQGVREFNVWRKAVFVWLQTRRCRQTYELQPTQMFMNSRYTQLALIAKPKNAEMGLNELNICIKVCTF